MSSGWLQIIENRLGGRLAANSCDAYSLDDFRLLSQELIRFHNSSKLPERSQHQLRPRLDGGGIWRAVGGVSSSAPKPMKAMVKSLLLLADSVALQDPVIAAWVGTMDGPDQLELLRKSIYEVAMIADLVRADVVVVYNPPPKLVSMNSGYEINDPQAVFGSIQEVEEAALPPNLLSAFQGLGLQFDWDAAWLAHAVEKGPQQPFSHSLLHVRPTGAAGRRSLLFRGNHELVERVQGLLWEHRVRYYYDGMCDPGPMSPATAELFCSVLRILRQLITARDESFTKDYFYLLSNPLVSADRVSSQDIVSLRNDSEEFAQWRGFIRESLDYAYNADHRYANRHSEFMRSMQEKIDALRGDLAAGRRGRFLAHSIEVGDAFTVGGAAGLAQYLLNADLAQSLIAAPAGALAAIAVRILKTLCVDEKKAIQAHFVAFNH